jgi:hypothetical protein
MAATPARLSISDAVEEILKRQRTAAAPAPAAVRAGFVQPAPTQTAGIQYGALHAPPPDDILDLRRQQAAFGQTTQELDRQNSWMAIPALAPLALPAIEGIGALGLRAAATRFLPEAPLDLPELEPWQRNSRQPGAPLDGRAKIALWDKARKTIARTDGVPASELGAQVHHSEPLEWAHLKPGADPNRRANLWPLPQKAHAIATREWAAFSRTLEGRIPTQAEIMRAKLRIDERVAPYLRSPGVSVSRLPPKGS